MKASHPFDNSSDWSRRIDESSSTERAFPRLTVGYGSVQSVASLAVLSKVEMIKEFLLYSNLFPVPVSHSPSSFTSPFGKRTVERNEQSPFSYKSVPNTSRMAQFSLRSTERAEYDRDQDDTLTSSYCIRFVVSSQLLRELVESRC